MPHRSGPRPPRPAGALRGPLLLALLLGGFQALLLLPLAAGPLRSAPADSAPRLFAWEPRADAPEDRVEGVGAVVRGKLYLFGGFADTRLAITGAVDVYDPAADRWERLPGQMPTPVTHIMPAVDGDTVWIAGGFVGDHPGPATAEVWAFHAPTNRWRPGPPLPAPRAGGALVRFGRALHFFGGFTADRDTTVADHWTLDLDDPRAWRPARPMPAPRGHLGAAALGGAIYAIGGQTGHDGDPIDRANVYRYTPRADRWEEVASLPTPRSHFEPSTFVLHGRIVIVGGRNNTVPGQGQLATALLYAPGEDQWIQLPALPYTRIAPVAQPLGGAVIVSSGGLQWDNPQRATLRGVLDGSWETDHPPLPAAPGAAQGAILGGRLYVVGASAEMVAYDLARGRWLAGNALAPRPFAGAGQAVVADGERLLVFGGAGESAGRVQRYDPAADRWSAGAAMPVAATEAAAARAADGWVYVAWAAPQPGLARYSPAADRWERLPAPPLARPGAALAADDSRLYLLGGAGAAGPTDTVQIYDMRAGAWATSAQPGAGVPPLPQPQEQARAVRLGGSLYLLGGRGPGGAPVTELQVYAIDARAWRLEPARPTASVAPAVAGIAGRLYVAGGAGGAALEVFNAAPLAPGPLGLRTFLPEVRR